MTQLDMDYIIEYEGFDPSGDVKTALKMLAERLSSEAPSDSFLKISVTGGANLLRGLIRIASRSGTFIAEANEFDRSDQSAVKLVDKLSNRISEQLFAWKAKRFPRPRVTRFSGLDHVTG